ncbi:hypothetical protein LSAT2_023206 [Lamellibrachia satsuma]|nr:hypothetical protein LSAT2_023206 [Lamellibrachia satsuma]
MQEASEQQVVSEDHVCMNITEVPGDQETDSEDKGDVDKAKVTGDKEVDLDDKVCVDTAQKPEENAASQGYVNATQKPEENGGDALHHDYTNATQTAKHANCDDYGYANTDMITSPFANVLEISEQIGAPEVSCAGPTGEWIQSPFQSPNYGFSTEPKAKGANPNRKPCHCGSIKGG